jgi:hypothetical protein
MAEQGVYTATYTTVYVGQYIAPVQTGMVQGVATVAFYAGKIPAPPENRNQGGA